MSSVSVAPIAPPAVAAAGPRPRSAPLALPLITATGAALLIAVKLGAVLLALAYALPGLLGLGAPFFYGLLAASLAATAYAAAAMFRRALAVERELAAAGAPPAAG